MSLLKRPCERIEMRERLEKRLQELKADFELGQQKLAALEAQVGSTHNTLLRISGAIQVLEEELASAAGEEVEALKAVHLPTENVMGKAGTS
jgi:predicted nuclease with TOPRIM domain